MALHPNFPQSPHEVSDPSVRWLPADEELRDTGYGKLIPPLVHKIREKVKAWRDDGYSGAAETKGREDSDVAPKMHRLAQWCEDVNRIQSDVSYDFVYVDEDNFRTYNPRTFQQLLEAFTEYKTRSGDYGKIDD